MVIILDLCEASPQCISLKRNYKWTEGKKVHQIFEQNSEKTRSHNFFSLSRTTHKKIMLRIIWHPWNASLTLYPKGRSYRSGKKNVFWRYAFRVNIYFSAGQGKIEIIIVYLVDSFSCWLWSTKDWKERIQ